LICVQIELPGIGTYFLSETEQRINVHSGWLPVRQICVFSDTSRCQWWEVWKVKPICIHVDYP
jgi:hypothetical protein